jgi:hypothetical protein
MWPLYPKIRTGVRVHPDPFGKAPSIHKGPSVGERVAGKPAPRFAASTEFRIELEPVDGATMVRLTSSQEPAGPVRGMVRKLFGTKEIAGNMERSLAKLTELTFP